MPDTRYLRVRNFDKFQSFSIKNLKQDRNPSWIKVYHALLADRYFYRLPDAQKFHVIGMFLIASQYDNKIPCDPEWIKHKLGAKTKIDLEALLASRFVEWVEPDGPVTPSLKEIVQKVAIDANSNETPKVTKSEEQTDTQRREEKSREEEKRVEGNPLAALGHGRSTDPPTDFAITGEMWEWAHREGFADQVIRRETDAMLDYFRAHGKRRTNWAATWRNWLRNSTRFGDKHGQRESEAEAKQRRTREASERLLARLAEQTRGRLPAGDDRTDSGDVPDGVG